MFLSAFFGLDALPVAEDFVGVFCGSVPENMGVSADELVADGSDDILHVESSEFVSE